MPSPLRVESGRFVPGTAMLISLIALLLSSCQDECQQTNTYTLYEPVYMSFDELRTAVKTDAPRQVHTAGKIYIIGKYLLVNEPNEGIHLFDNSDPANPENVAFITIPGNVDMAVKGNILYADSHVDLVALDISNPAAIREVGRVENIFPAWTRTFASTQQVDPTRGVLINWKEVKTVTVGECTDEQTIWYENYYALDSRAAMDNASAALPGKPGIGGSMARFTLYDQYLYTIDNQHMQLFDISVAAKPVAGSQVNLGWNIETIFPYGDKLFIGSQTGMHIYDNANPASPVHISTFAHVQSCDPVVVEGKYAYVTLRSGTTCNRAANQLDVIDISDLATPTLVKSYVMDNPHGLGIDKGTLFVCDGNAGLKVYDASNPLTINLRQLSAQPGHSFDVIPHNNVAIVTGEDGIYQYDYSDPEKLKLLSKIALKTP